MQAESGLCVCIWQEEVYCCSAVMCFIGPFALCLPERTAVQLKDGTEASQCTLQSLGESKRHLEIDQKVI